MVKITENKMFCENRKRRFSESESTQDHKKFIPETSLQMDDQEVNFDILAKNIKIEAADNYESNSGDDLANDLMADIANSTDNHSFDVNSEGDDENIIVIHMDIRDPLFKLRDLLVNEVGGHFDDFSFTLQDSKVLQENKNLVDQCVQGHGKVQINLQLKCDELGKRINIVDVLKPNDEELLEHETGEEDDDDDDDDDDDEDYDDGLTSENMARWTIDYGFKNDQVRLNIPEDPEKWDTSHVRHWLMWAVRQFNLSGIQLSQWSLTGEDLTKMTSMEFQAKVPRDPQKTFWTHFELLRKCKLVATIPQSDPNIKQETLDEDDIEDEEGELLRKEVLQKSKLQNRVRLVKSSKSYPMFTGSTEEYTDITNQITYQPASSGPIQLWQFLLELLTDYKHRGAIQWLENEGEFRLVNPELVAHLWGLRKNKPTMNYEKLSRALRYYYDGDMISKVQGKRFVYKFVCDLKQMMGFSATELNDMVLEAQLKAKQKKNILLEDGSCEVTVKPDIITIYHQRDLAQKN